MENREKEYKAASKRPGKRPCNHLEEKRSLDHGGSCGGRKNGKILIHFEDREDSSSWLIGYKLCEKVRSQR